MHPWAAYLITADMVEREERHRRTRSAARRPAPTRAAGAVVRAAGRPIRAMGCAV
ncbi:MULTISPECIES: hypothetical protein [Mumia]|uniref:Uncharacterized protein n=1 Tax=Mumia xiangluensis TaxID=1678900 RepID=A0ABW1QG37_9ACTN|nr:MULTISPECIES: hypothetical protein [Mumia]